MLNKATLIGNLGADPEARFTPTGKQTTTFSIATTEKWKDANGDINESTEWHRVVTWGRLAEICSEYLGKGSKVYIEGKIQTRKWTDSAGVDRYTTEIVAREMKMLSSKAGLFTNDGLGGSGPEVPPLPEQPQVDDVPF